MRRLTWTWAALIALALATTLVAGLAPTAPAGLRIGAAAVLLALGWGKAGLILGRFLGLEAAPGWLAGLRLAVGLFLAVALGLYAAAG